MNNWCINERRVLCWSTGKFSETRRQPVSSLTAVEETHPVGTSKQPGLAQSNVVEPDFVRGLGVQHVENQLFTPKFYQQTHQDITADCSTAVVTPRKDFGTQTGLLLCCCSFNL